MRRISLLILLGLLSFRAMSQEGEMNDKKEVDPRLVEVFGDQLEKLVLNDKDRLNGLNLLLEKRVKIIIEPYATFEKYPKLSEFSVNNSYNKDLKRDEVFDINTFNVLKYNLSFFSNREIKYYRVDNTDYLIKILSQNLKE
ncbi:hypothetical protein EG240_11545 [Paenimyroides tangerinum]|uniref:Uncharacterized protein n=1 Tax=Paenimyroides tangerinum TaxID=2488728 RepID=A0A3P3W2U3_9FLAO|nr:hypothetical protein [Paenimyroides tangerinum]RRJ89432.1 hypothetical protein EG240_11545 [Paenimyroides tangerinum]